MKNIIAFIVSLLITFVILNIIKLPPILGFIVGSILWSLLHYQINKLL